MGPRGATPQLPLAAIEDVVAAHAALNAARRLGILDRPAGSEALCPTTLTFLGDASTEPAAARMGALP